MQIIYRVIVLIAALIIVGEKAQGVVKALIVRAFKRAEKSLDLEFELWWTSGPQQIVRDNIKDTLKQENTDKAQKIEAKARQAAIILALYVNHWRRYLTSDNEVTVALLSGVEAAMYKPRQVLNDHGVNPWQLEHYFTRSH